MEITPLVPRSDQISSTPLCMQLLTPLPIIGNASVLHLNCAALF